MLHFSTHFATSHAWIDLRLRAWTSVDDSVKEMMKLAEFSVLRLEFFGKLMTLHQRWRTEVTHSLDPCSPRLTWVDHWVIINLDGLLSIVLHFLFWDPLSKATEEDVVVHITIAKLKVDCSVLFGRLQFLIRTRIKVCSVLVETCQNGIVDGFQPQIAHYVEFSTCIHQNF